MAEIIEATAAVDEVMAEPWQLLPRKMASDVNAPNLPDVSRPLIVFSGTYLDSEAKPDMPNSYDRRQVRRPGIESGKAIVLVSPAAQVLMGTTIGSPDQILRLADAKTWRITNSFKMAGGTLRLHVNLSS